MENKTAVSWLVEQLAMQNGLAFYNDNQDIIQQAKAMEKEQMMNMYLRGIENYDPTFKRKSQWTSANNDTPTGVEWWWKNNNL
jgi:hypothetical protein